jgi:hypothetical protein
MFMPQYDNTTLPDKQRIQGMRSAAAKVYYVEKSFSDGKPVWRFDHGGAGVLIIPCWLCTGLTCCQHSW